MLQRYCKTLYNSSMAFASYYHQLAPAFYMAISSKLHFTPHHDYAYCYKLDCASNSNLGMQLSPALQSPFSFHLVCGYARKKNARTCSLESYALIMMNLVYSWKPCHSSKKQSFSGFSLCFKTALPTLVTTLLCGTAIGMFAMAVLS